jgi:site-specific recombinase XerD
MAVKVTGFFDYIDDFIDYRKDIYLASDQTLKTNRIDLKLFENFIGSKSHKSINGPAVMEFQYHLKKDRDNCGGSINRKIFTLRSYSHFLRLQDVPDAETLPFYDVLKIRQGYRNRPNALTTEQMKRVFDSINRETVLGIRDYAVYALMYQTGLRVGEVHNLDLTSIDFENRKLIVVGKGNKRRELYLTDEMVQVLSEWIAVRPYLYKSKQNCVLFVSKKGNRLAIRTMEDNFKKILIDILVIQSLLGHSSTRSTEPYIHPSFEKIRHAMEKLPGVVYMKELVELGILNLKFQSEYHKRE